MEMKPLAVVLFVALCTVTLCLPNQAPYITQAGRPLNIAHRGLSSILPENTLQAFEAAWYQGADFIELDVVYTKEKELLVMHDPFLTRITNVKNITEFNDKYETRVYGGKNKTDWWTDRFTLNELRKLGIKQAQAPGRISIFDYQFTFPLLGDVLQACIQFNQEHRGKRNPDGRLGGVLIEAKDSQMYRDLYGLEIGQTILELLQKVGLSTIDEANAKCPIWLHTFDYGTVKYWGVNTKLPNNYLVGKGTQIDFKDVAKYATGIGFQDNMIWDYANNKITDLIHQTKD
jgi:glycerophosphoryl diester phosphodiesterase